MLSSFVKFLEEEFVPTFTNPHNNVGRRGSQDLTSDERKDREFILQFLQTAVQSLFSIHAELSVHQEGIAGNDGSVSKSKALEEGGRGAVLSGHLPCVQTLCLALEQCLIHKMREFSGIIPLWALIQQALLNPPGHGGSTSPDTEEPPSRALLRKIASTSQLSTPLGKARGWIRASLVNGSLASSIETLRTHPDILEQYYYDSAVMMSQSASDTFISICHSLTSFEFSIEIADDDLNTQPMWALLADGESRGGAGQEQRPSISVSVEDSSHAAAKAPVSHSPQHSRRPSRALGLFGSVGGGGITVPCNPSGIFGRSWEELCCTPARASTCHLDPSVEMPDAISSLLVALSHPLVLSEPGLFLTSDNPSPEIESACNAIVRSMEENNRVPSGEEGVLPPHALARTLLKFLREMPNPLLTFECRDAFLACAYIESHGALVRNLRLLVDELPWAHRPLLVRLCGLFSAFLDERYSALNGITVGDLARVLAPLILRPKPEADLGKDDAVRQEASDAVKVVESILAAHEEVLCDASRELLLRRRRLAAKVIRLQQLQRMYSAKIYLRRKGTMTLVRSIWLRLGPMVHVIATLSCPPASPSSFQDEDGRERVDSAVEPASTQSIELLPHHYNRSGSLPAGGGTSACLEPALWQATGLISPSTLVVADALRAAGRILTLDCLQYLLIVYPLTLAPLLAAASPQTEKSDTDDTIIAEPLLPRLAAIVGVVTEAFQLAPVAKDGQGEDPTSTAEEPRDAALRLSQKPCWRLLSSHWAIHECVAAALILSEQLATHSTSSSISPNSNGEGFFPGSRKSSNVESTRPRLRRRRRRRTLVEVLPAVQHAVKLAVSSSRVTVANVWIACGEAAGLVGGVMQHPDECGTHPRIAINDAAAEATDMIGDDVDRLELREDLEDSLGITPLLIPPDEEASRPLRHPPATRISRRVLTGDRQSSLRILEGDDDASSERSVSPVRVQHEARGVNAAEDLAWFEAQLLGKRSEDEGVVAPPSAPIRLLSKSALLTPTTVEALRSRLPHPWSDCDRWRMLFSVDRDGASLATLMSLCGKADPTLVVIGDEGGGVFGGLAVGCAWDVCAGEQGLDRWGGGQSFVYSFNDCEGGGAIRLWKHLSRDANVNILYKDHSTGLGMGGGGAGFAWFVDDSLARGTSGSSDTFKNDCLASAPDFKVIGLEIWEFAGVGILRGGGMSSTALKRKILRSDGCDDYDALM